MSEEMIEPCPFCGSQAELMEGHRNHWRVECPRCGVRRAQFANGGVDEDKACAIRSWNKRTAYNPNERLREALVEARRWVQAAHDDRDTGTQSGIACFNALQEIDRALEGNVA